MISLDDFTGWKLYATETQMNKSASLRLPRAFFRRDPVTVARELLGQRLVHVVNGHRLAGLIVETEAYLGVQDRAAHSFGGRRTARTETMYADGGTAYVFLNYGIHNLLNIVTDTIDTPTAVLLRAIEPTEGLDAMFLNRPAAKQETGLCSGPGKLGSAFAIDRTHDGIDLVTSPALFIERARKKTLAKNAVTVSPRVGIDYAANWATAPLRFHLSGNPNVSRI